MRTFLQRASVAFLLAMGTAGVSSAQDAIPPEILQKVKQASAFVKVSLGPLEYSGSGFVIHVEDHTLYLVTNAHVVAKPDLQAAGSLPPGLRMREALEWRKILLAIQNLEPEVSIVLNSGTPNELVRQAEVISRDSERDLAILKVADVPSPPAPIALETDYKPVETTPVFTFGFPFGEALSKTKGNPAITVGRGAVSSLRLDERGEDSVVQIDGALNPGNSGGPVVDARGRLVGVAVATIRGSGIGFAIPPATLHKILVGGISHVHVTRRPSPEGWAVDVELTLFDPYRKIQQLAAHCAAREVKGVSPPVQQPLDDSQKVDLVIENGKAKGTWKMGNSAAKPEVVTVQPVRIDAEGKALYLAVTQLRFASTAPQVAGNGSRPALPGPRRVPALNAPPNVHVIQGSTRKLGEKSLVEGMLVVPKKSPALGMGVVQTGETTMNFTYFLVVRLPPGEFSRKTSAVRNSTADKRIRVSFSMFLDDLTLAIEHLYSAAADALQEEQFTIQDQNVDPGSGRVFLVDLTSEPSRVIQHKFDLPRLESLLQVDDSSISELADKTYNELLKQHAEVRIFVEGKK